MVILIPHLDIDDCKPNSCVNGGECIDLINDIQCKCPVGFEGKRCEKSK